MIPISEQKLPYANCIESVVGSCDKHGAFTTFRHRNSDQITCPTCFDDSIRHESLEQANRDRIARLDRLSGVPVRYAGFGFNDFTQALPAQQRAVAAVTLFMNAMRTSTRGVQMWSSLYIFGSVGTGKTHLACALVNNLTKRGICARYVTMVAMLADIKRAYSAQDLTEAGQIARYVDEPDLLVIDEADVIRGTENDLGLIFGVVNGRYNAGKPMAIVSNQTVDGLAGFIGERTVDRLRENLVMVSCNWASHRSSLTP